MDMVAKAATPEEIERVNARIARANLPPAKQQLPEGFQAETTLPLTVPVEWNGTIHSEVSIRRLKGRDFMALQRMTGDESVGLLSIVTGLPPEVIAELDADDFVTMSEAAQDFLPLKLRAAAGLISAAGQGSPA